MRKPHRRRHLNAGDVIAEHLHRWCDRLEKEGKLSDVNVERVEWALAMVAYMMELDGPVYAPLYENLERALEELRRQEDTVARAKRLLETCGGQPPLAAIAPPVLALAPPIEGEGEDEPDAVFTAPRRAPNQA